MEKWGGENDDQGSVYVFNLSFFPHFSKNHTHPWEGGYYFSKTHILQNIHPCFAMTQKCYEIKNMLLVSEILIILMYNFGIMSHSAVM